MISAAVNSLSPDFSGLTAEISKSVSHIRAKAAALHLNSPETAGTENVNGFQLNGCAVSYLEPQSLFAVQKFVSETGEGERLNRQPRQKNVFNEEGKNAPEIGQAETPVSFWEELASVAIILRFAKACLLTEPQRPKPATCSLCPDRRPFPELMPPMPMTMSRASIPGRRF